MINELYTPEALEVLRKNWPFGHEVASFFNEKWKQEQSAPKSDVETINE